MSGLDVAALLIMLLTVAIGIAILAFLGTWPGRVAARRSHPYSTAIQVGGWATLLGGGIFWPLVLMWAFADGEEPDLSDDIQIDPHDSKEPDRRSAS